MTSRLNGPDAWSQQILLRYRRWFPSVVVKQARMTRFLVWLCAYLWKQSCERTCHCFVEATGVSTSRLCWQHRPLVNFVNSLSSLRHLVRVRPEVTAARQLELWLSIVRVTILNVFLLSCTASTNVRKRVRFIFYFLDLLPCFGPISVCWFIVKEWGWVHIVWFTHIKTPVYQSLSWLHYKNIHCCFAFII